MINQRKSHQAFNQIYFWTATINNWQCILEADTNKKKIIEVLEMLSSKKLVTVYAFVIMPNHIHVIWEQHDFYGKETPLAAFMKKTSRYLLKQLEQQGIDHTFIVGKANKSREIWKRDSLAIELYSRNIAFQKLEYVHANPIRGKWKLAKDFISYPFSSAQYYELAENDFGFLKNLCQLIDGYC
jgi:REP element-mobilizing transposase RayT